MSISKLEILAHEPSQEADAVSRLGSLLVGSPEALEATGTDDLVAVAKNGAQQLVRKPVLSDAQQYSGADKEGGQHRSPKPLQIADLGAGVQGDATLFASSGGGTRTTPLNPDENRQFQNWRRRIRRKSRHLAAIGSGHWCLRDAG